MVIKISLEKQNVILPRPLSEAVVKEAREKGTTISEVILKFIALALSLHQKETTEKAATEIINIFIKQSLEKYGLLEKELATEYETTQLDTCDNRRERLEKWLNKPRASAPVLSNEAMDRESIYSRDE